MKAIQGNPQSIGNLFRMHEFEIPEFQRPYSWGKDECDQLWEDISVFLDRTVSESDKDAGQEKYFLGSIVVYPKPEKEKVLCVIDGQQRLTTLLLLVKALFEKATTSTILEKIIYKENPETGNIRKGEPRIESCVLTKKDKDALGKILNGEVSALHKKNLFRTNYECLQDHLGKWWSEKKPNERTKIIKALQDNVVMLPIQCSTEDDALTLFQIINDRGRPLDDSDIFKAKLYHAVLEKDRVSFINRWDKIENHENLFRIYMYISKAEQGNIDKEIGLRKYMLDQGSLGNRDALSQNYESIMHALEVCHWLKKNNVSDDADLSADENIYWGIMRTYRIMYWSYPLHVFLHKHMKRDESELGRFSLHKDYHEKYKKLMKDTMRYFFIKGVVHNAVNSIKDTTFKVCRAIAQDKDYASEYRNNIGREIDTFYKKLDDSDYGQRYRKGLILLSSLLNPKQSRVEYGKVLTTGEFDIEHILPKAWCNYDRWTPDSHKQYLDKIGNLMPLEKATNSKASNEFFERKMEDYKDSKIQDALDLSTKASGHWYPDDVEQRQKDALDRLRSFFSV